MYPCYVAFFVLAYHVVLGLSSSATTYDQRQTGDLNVQVHVKDVQVLAVLDSELLDDYTEYDYFYDYADFTVKPIVKPTTSSTEAPLTPGQDDISEPSDSPSENSTSPLTSASSNANSTNDHTKAPVPTDVEKINESTTISPLENTENLTSDEMVITLKTRINDKTGDLFDDDEGDVVAQNGGRLSTENTSKGSSRKRCKSGYSPNGKGRCRRLSQRRLSLIPLAVKLAPKLFNDLSRSARNLTLEEVDRMHSN